MQFSLCSFLSILCNNFRSVSDLLGDELGQLRVRVASDDHHLSHFTAVHGC